MDPESNFVQVCPSASVSAEESPDLVAVKVIRVLSPAKITLLYEHVPHRALLEALEEDIASSWKDAASIQSLPLSSSMFIAVREGRDETRCKRGFVTAVTGKRAEVFLCDYGIIIDIDTEDKGSWRPLEDNFRSELGFFGSIVVIPGLGAGRSLKLPKGTKVIPTKTWSGEALSATENWLNEASKVALTIFERGSPPVIYGDFYKRESRIPLSSYLVESNLALVDAEVFQKLTGLRFGQRSRRR